MSGFYTNWVIFVQLADLTKTKWSLYAKYWTLTNTITAGHYVYKLDELKHTDIQIYSIMQCSTLPSIVYSYITLYANLTSNGWAATSFHVEQTWRALLNQNRRGKKMKMYKCKYHYNKNKATTNIFVKQFWSIIFNKILYQPT